MCYLVQFVKAFLVGSDFRFEGLVTQELAVNVLGVPVGVVLRRDVLLAQPISELLALLQELLQLELILDSGE